MAAIDALTLAWINKRYADVCRSEAKKEPSSMSMAKLKARTKRIKDSGVASLIAANHWQDPSVFDGSTPQKSFVAVEARRAGVRLEQDVHLEQAGRPWRALLDESASILDPVIVVSAAVGGEGNITTKKQIWGRSRGMVMGGVVEGEVHVMMVPWRTKQNDQTKLRNRKFKLTGLRSC